MTDQTNEIKTVVIISNQQIDDIMVTALEGGINYWVNGVDAKVDVPDREYLSDIISRGGSLNIQDDEGDVFVLDKAAFKKGLGMAMKDGNGFDRENYDAGDADRVIQYAIYGKLVWG